MRDFREREDLRRQYGDSTNLDARRALHERFSASREHWHDWVFRQFELPGECSVIEVGCGSGELWARRGGETPAGWRITLSDASEGMLGAARERLAPLAHRLNFVLADVADMPFRSGAFDAVIANHMLYHAQDVRAAISEIARVLKDAGTLYAATNGAAHMRELREIVRALAPGFSYGCDSPVKTFSLENGKELLAHCFDSVELRMFEGDLEIDEAEPVVSYVLSISGSGEFFSDVKTAELRARVAEIIRRRGAFRVTRSTGLFVAGSKTKSGKLLAC